MARAFVVAAVVAAIGALAVGRLQDPHKAVQVAAPSQPVLEFARDDLAQATTQKVARTVPVTGTLMPLEQSIIKARAPGVVLEVLAREGESVRRGQLVARIDATEVRAQLAARQADIAAARAQLDWARRNLQRQGELLAKGFISANAYDSVKNEEAVARARLDAAQAQAAQVHKLVADQTLVAPLSGIVAKRHAEPGERLPADTPILTVVSLDRLELTANVPTTEIADVALGQAVRVRVDGFGGRLFEGRVERINPQATAGTGVVPVYVIVENPEHALRAGLFAHGELVLSSDEPRTTIPAAALHEPDGNAYVYVIDQNTVRRRAVEVAFVVDQRAVLEGGVSPGETVVAANLGALPEGAQARLPATATAREP
ncbi:MAG TPA: efflux RND transporter periplasmic adaptor subunit [Burkholderiales bacterium]|nr:efflux RND transporter periplasmic adaptor subunit [Burkholderiales bacterium]